MTKEDYLAELKDLLSPLSSEELTDVLDYFKEYFEENQDDAAAMEQLGSPQKAAEEILKNLGKQGQEKQEQSNDSSRFFNQETFQKELTEKIQQEISERVEKTFTQVFSSNWQRQEHAEPRQKKGFWQSFFKNVHFPQSAQPLIQKGPFALEQFDSLKLALEDENLVICTTSSPLPQISYEFLWEPDDLPLPFHQVENGVLCLSSDDEADFAKITLALPKDLSLSKISGHLDDSNLTVTDITMERLTIEANDSNITLKNTAIETFALEANDSNLTAIALSSQEFKLTLADSNATLKQVNIQSGNIIADDSNLTAQDFTASDLTTSYSDSHVVFNQAHISHRWTTEADDSNLVLKTQSDTACNYDISGEDSQITLPRGFYENLENAGDSFRFSSQEQGAERSMIIRVSDSTLVLS